MKRSSSNGAKRKIWIDLDNSPHVPFFLPIIRRLREEGHRVEISARDCFQTCELLDLAGIDYQKIGRHYGRSPIRKVLGLLVRSAQLYRFGRRKDFSVAVSHGSRALILAAKALSIANINMFDYEYSIFGLGIDNVPTKQILPAAITDDLLPRRIDPGRVVKFQGFKEEVYVSEFRPDPDFINRAGFDDQKVIALLRPPATEANYHDPQSELLFQRVIELMLAHPNTLLVLLPRTSKQATALAQLKKAGENRIVLPNKALDGLNLVWHSDLVISGGGTMNREAAFLGVPAYSIFTGQTSAVDKALIRQNKIVLISNEAQVAEIKIEKRKRARDFEYQDNNPASTIINEILKTAASGRA